MNVNCQKVGMSPRPRWPHQDIIMTALSKIYADLDPEQYVVRIDSSITDNWNDVAPDIVVFNSVNYPLMVMEVASHRDLKRNQNKCTALLERFPDAEFYVYDYEREVLYMLEADENSWVSSNECELCSVYLYEPVESYFM